MRRRGRPPSQCDACDWQAGKLRRWGDGSRGWDDRSRGWDDRSRGGEPHEEGRAADEEPAPVERRIAENHHCYTFAQFRSHYGSGGATQKWNEADVATRGRHWCCEVGCSSDTGTLIVFSSAGAPPLFRTPNDQAAVADINRTLQ